MIHAADPVTAAACAATAAASAAWAVLDWSLRTPSSAGWCVFGPVVQLQLQLQLSQVQYSYSPKASSLAQQLPISLQRMQTSRGDDSSNSSAMGADPHRQCCWRNWTEAGAGSGEL